MLQLLKTSKAMQIVQTDSEKDRIAHTYFVLFQDKKYLQTCLKEVAKVILQADSRVAQLIDNNQYVDCKIYPQEDGKRILADDVRAIIEDSSILPLESKKKVYILNNMQTMQAVAQNKLLKVLEEPPPFLHFILGATQQDAILPTVQSRAKVLQWNDFSTTALLQFIDRKYPNASNKKSAILLANGSISRLEEILQEQNPILMPQYILQKLATLQAADILEWTKIYTDKDTVYACLATMQVVLREILLYHIGNTECRVFTHGNMLEKSEQGRTDLLQVEAESYSYLQLAAKRYKPQRILLVLDKIVQAVEDIENNGNVSQILFSILLTILEGK